MHFSRRILATILFVVSVTAVTAVFWWPAVRTGHAIAERLGCFRCHGPGGRGAGRNPGSLKGYIPPWDGRDFAELVLDEAELREWILGGRPQRLQANPLGSVLPRSPGDSDARVPRPDHGGGVAGARSLHRLVAPIVPQGGHRVARSIRFRNKNRTSRVLLKEAGFPTASPLAVSRRVQRSA